MRTISVMCPSLHESVVPQTNKDNHLYILHMSFRELFPIRVILICVFHAFVVWKRTPVRTFQDVPMNGHYQPFDAKSKGSKLRRNWRSKRFVSSELLKNKTKQQKLQKYCPQLARVFEAGQCVQNMKLRLRLLSKESLPFTLRFLSLVSQFRS